MFHGIREEEEGKFVSTDGTRVFKHTREQYIAFLYTEIEHIKSKIESISLERPKNHWFDRLERTQKEIKYQENIINGGNSD